LTNQDKRQADILIPATEEDLKYIVPCSECGHKGWIFVIIKLSTEIVCEKCGRNSLD